MRDGLAVPIQGEQFRIVIVVREPAQRLRKAIPIANGNLNFSGKGVALDLESHAGSSTGSTLD